jgi:hypothetical protein
MSRIELGARRVVGWIDHTLIIRRDIHVFPNLRKSVNFSVVFNEHWIVLSIFGSWITMEP